jgi:hypothetical protein
VVSIIAFLTTILIYRRHREDRKKESWSQRHLST